MVNVNWFPGHMHKARKEIANSMKRVQIVVELLDARCPFSTENPLLPGLRGPDTPCIKVLNKADLADTAQTKKWIEHFEQESGVLALALQASNKEQSQRLVRAAESMILRSTRRSSNIMIVGIPNVGKSTLINTLAGRAVCRTGDVPAVTRAQQLISISPTLNLVDTPGFLWPKLEPQPCAMRLAISGAVKEVAFDYVDIGLAAVEHLATLYPNVLMEKFSCSPEQVAAASVQQQQRTVEKPLRLDDDKRIARNLLEQVAKRRGCLRQGGVPDLEQAGRALVNEFRKGRLGHLTLETPEMIVQEGGVQGKIDGVRGAERRKEIQAEKRRIRKLGRNKKIIDSV